MKKIIKIEIYHDGEFYCARRIDFDVFSQGTSLDEVVENIKESIILYFEDDPSELAGFDWNPSIFSMMDLKDKDYDLCSYSKTSGADPCEGLPQQSSRIAEQPEIKEIHYDLKCVKACS